jgi:hypothetical protein
VARIRFSRAEAESEATRLAEEFIAGRADRDQFRHRVTRPDPLAVPSCASKHPVAWVVAFEPIPKNGEAIDGGELFVTVDLEAGSVAIQQG